MNRHRTYWSLMGPSSEKEIMGKQQIKQKDGKWLTAEEREALISIVRVGMASDNFPDDRELFVKMRAINKCLDYDAGLLV